MWIMAIQAGSFCIDYAMLDRLGRYYGVDPLMTSKAEILDIAHQQGRIF